jgi:hypothetical protein
MTPQERRERYLDIVDGHILWLSYVVAFEDDCEPTRRINALGALQAALEHEMHQHQEGSR